MTKFEQIKRAIEHGCIVEVTLEEDEPVLFSDIREEKVFGGHRWLTSEIDDEDILSFKPLPRRAIRYTAGQKVRVFNAESTYVVIQVEVDAFNVVTYELVDAEGAGCAFAAPHAALLPVFADESKNHEKESSLADKLRALLDEYQANQAKNE